MIIFYQSSVTTGENQIKLTLFTAQLESKVTRFIVFQNATQGTLVAQFNATDADLNQNAEIGYRIVSGNGDGVFDINNHTGELFTVKELDHEKVTQYQVSFKANQ